MRQPTGIVRQSLVLALGLFATGVFAADACAPERPLRISALSAASRDLLQATVLLESGHAQAQTGYLACLRDGVHQGLSPQRAADVCATQLMEDIGVGLGGDPIAGFGDAVGAFDPGKIVDACGASDPERAQDTSVHHVSWLYVDHTKYLKYENGRAVKANGDDFMSQYGSFSYGGDPSKRLNADGEPLKPGQEAWHYLGMTREQSQAIKAEWIKEADEAKAAWRAAEDAAKADPGNKEKRQKADAALKKWEDADRKASSDPNFQPKSTTQDAGEASACDMVTTAAREMLRECHRNAWRSAECQELHARMNGCPDPTQILIDPDAGYVCAPAVDPALVAAAWQARCEELTTPGPDGSSPCVPPDVQGHGYILERSGDICSDPRAYVDGDSGVCVRTLEADGFGDPDVRSLIEIALARFGGPIVVIPSPAPAPFPLGGPK